MVQTVLGEIWKPLKSETYHDFLTRAVLNSSGAVDHEYEERDYSVTLTRLYADADGEGRIGIQDIDVFCTAASAPAVRTALVNSGYWLSGFHGDYDISESPTLMLDSCIHRVEGYSPDHGDEDEAELSEAMEFSENLGLFPEFPVHLGCDDTLMNTSSFRRQSLVPLEGASGESIPFYNDCTARQLDLVVAEPECMDARVLLDAFDIVICRASFDGTVFRIPDPHLTFKRQTALEPHRKQLLDRVCQAAGADGENMQGDLPTDDVAHEGTGKFSGGLSWEQITEVISAKLFKNSRLRATEHQKEEHFFHNFVAKLLHRHRKYAKRGISFVDHEAHLLYVKMADRFRYVPMSNGELL
jgi:hypothetical protein